MEKTIKAEFAERFDSIEQFINTINSRETSSLFKGYEKVDTLKSQDTTPKYVKFTGTHTYIEADKLAVSGVKSLAREIIDASGLKSNTTSARPRNCAGIVGCAPIVPRAIIGLPESMITRKSAPYKSRVATIYYNLNTHRYITQSEITQVGARVVNCIDKLERAGVRVELYVTMINHSAGEKPERVSVCVCLKKASQPLNVLKIAYFIAHAAFKRRHFFRYLETKPELSADWDGYGYTQPLGVDTADKYARNDRYCILNLRDCMSLGAKQIYDTIVSSNKL